MILGVSQERKGIYDLHSIFVDVGTNVKQSLLALLLRAEEGQVRIAPKQRGQERIVLNDPSISILQFLCYSVVQTNKLL